MKLSAIAQRGARKDFCDIYALVKNNYIKGNARFYARKFQSGRQPVLYDYLL